MQIGVINDVRTIKRIEITSTPNLNFIKSFIQDYSYKNWKSNNDKSNEKQTKNDKLNLYKLLKREM